MNVARPKVNCFGVFEVDQSSDVLIGQASFQRSSTMAASRMAFTGHYELFGQTRPPGTVV